MPSIAPVAPRNPSANADAWKSFDKQSVSTSEGGVRTVDHGASVVPNLKLAGKQLASIFTPDHFEAAAREDSYMFGGLNKGLAAAEEVVDVVRMPVAALKNVVDAATHGVIALGRKFSEWFA